MPSLRLALRNYAKRPLEYTWAGKPAYNAVPLGTEIIITDYGVTGRSIWFAGATGWQRDAPLLIYAKGDVVASTTSSTEVALLTIPVLGGSLGPNGGVELEWTGTYPNSANAKEMRVRIGVGAFSTAFAQLYYRDMGSSTQQVHCRAGFINANSVSAQASTSPAYVNGYGLVNLAIATGAIDTASDFNVFISAKMNGTESVALRACRAWLIYGA